MTQSNLDPTPKLTWMKSSYSGPNGNCVEIAVTATVMAVRDSKNPESILKFSHGQWREFLDKTRREASRRDQ